MGKESEQELEEELRSAVPVGGGDTPGGHSCSQTASRQ